jgi:hypothetical protein
LRQLARRAARLQADTPAAAAARAGVRVAHAGTVTAELGGRVAQASAQAIERTINEAEEPQ